MKRTTFSIRAPIALQANLTVDIPACRLGDLS